MKNTHFHVDTVAYYLIHLKPDISPIKLHKSLYFLFAYYGATYNKLLFDTKFQAWKFGPVAYEVYSKYSDYSYSELKKIEKATQLINSKPEIADFIHDLFNQIDTFSDFTLVERSHQDEAWKRAYRIAQATEINNDFLIDEYKTRYM